MLVRILACVVASALLPARAALAQATEFEDCLGPESISCAQTPGALLDSLCGQRFYEYRGRVAWPALRNVGPITIALRTRSIPGTTIYPLMVEVVQRASPGCDLNHVGPVVLTASGADQCGGTTESIGPIDLTNQGIRLGTLYYVRVVFFQSVPLPFFGWQYLTVGLSCIRVTSHPTGVASVPWGGVKALYK